jgi:hypothetical protein
VRLVWTRPGTGRSEGLLLAANPLTFGAPGEIEGHPTSGNDSLVTVPVGLMLVEIAAGRHSDQRRPGSPS